jgi:hypothetical protein
MEFYSPSFLHILITKIKKKGNDKASGNKRFISINRPAKEPNHRVLITGATERYLIGS